MSHSDELLALSAVELRRRLGTKEISPVELMDLVIPPRMCPDPMSGASTPSGSTNPSPGMSGTTGAGDARSGSGQPGGSKSQKTLEGNQGAERNPDGSTGGSKTNPSPPSR